MILTLLDDALELASRGWSLHPCLPGDKRPATKWRDTATNDPATVSAWWSDEWKTANIGVATGAPSGIIVVDIDDLDSIQTLREKGDLPSTLTARTPRGGLHLYYRRGQLEVPNSAGALAPGVDVRGDGGYVLSPGSSLPNGRYTWVEQRDLAPLPSWIAEASRKPAKPQLPVTSTEASGSSRWGASVLDRELASLMAAPEGQRNDTLYHCAMKIAGACKAGELDEAHAERQLLLLAERVGLEAGETRGTVESAWQAAEPRGPKDRPQQAVTTGVPTPEPQVQVGAQAEPQAEQQSGWLSVDDLLNMPPLEWLIPQQIPVGLTMLYGPYGSGKSFVAMDWALSLACGLIGPPRTVCYALGEGVAGFGARIRAWREYHGHEILPGRFLARTGSQFPRLNDPGSIAELCRDIERLPEPPDLLIVDTLARSLPGGEEDARGFSHAVAVCDDLRNRYGTSTLLVHHSGVNPDRERGHTSLGAACDAVWKLEPPDLESGGRHHRMVNTKLKDGDRHPSIERTLRSDGRGSALILHSAYQLAGGRRRE